MKNLIIIVALGALITAGAAFIYFETDLSSNLSTIPGFDRDAKLTQKEEKPKNLSGEDPGENPSDKTLGVTAPKLVPSFDVVRVTRGGRAVIAGRAPAGSTVTILDGGVQIGSVKADPQGEWVLVPDHPLKTGVRELTIEAVGIDGQILLTEEVVVLSVPDRSISSVEPLVVLTDKSRLKPSRILQKEDDESDIDPSTDIAVDIIDYDDDGNIIVSGRTAQKAEVRLYADGELLGSGFADESGVWVVIVNERLAPGNYDLRADKIGVEGKVIARSIIPFTRAEPAKLKLRDGQVIVQPGNSLWRIARAAYGSGLRYTIIYNANRNHIQDPDLIFPGQIFKVPENEE